MSDLQGSCFCGAVAFAAQADIGQGTTTTMLQVVADAVGLDLAFGSAAFQRSQRAASSA